ncbi:hypothetical protein G7Z17_g1967 [Cylindrodendrum hubeiense]|uniref:Uncharacterized protein n=1 Tax=Cylindrodendrum hubeiense TaxID=595255 RepID=A0A9P5HJP3_9HYPO|nr:hypothetical protein G7Z17_g1967 [Cylindrodendrum hubeiense]
MANHPAAGENAVNNPPVVKSPAALFAKPDQLNRDSTACLATRHGIEDDDSGWDLCLAGDLQVTLFDEIYDHVWPFARNSGNHIDALHKQLVKKRSIVVAEDPNLHLIWYHDTIYVKPLPDYLLNFAIWDGHISKPPAQAFDERLRYDKYRAAAGFIRSYGLLIQHQSDFVIAHQSNLLPEDVSFHDFQKFIRRFRDLQDEDVSHRYQYGQFRLSRLNWVVIGMKLTQPLRRRVHHPVKPLPWLYHETQWEMSQYIQYYAAPFIFVFALLSLILGSMQVILAALGPNTWAAFVTASWGFSVATIIFAASPMVTAVLGGGVVILAQFWYAARMRWKEKHQRNDEEVQDVN